MPSYVPSLLDLMVYVYSYVYLVNSSHDVRPKSYTSSSVVRCWLCLSLVFFRFLRVAQFVLVLSLSLGISGRPFQTCVFHQIVFS